MKPFINELLFILIYMLFDHLPLSKGQYIKCPLYQQHFEKVIGYRPPSISLTDLNLIKRANRQPNGLPTAINRECWTVCKNDVNCAGYMLFYNASECYGFTRNERNHRYELLHDGEGLKPDADAVYFEKICLDIPPDCKRKLWPVVRVPGNVLIERGYLTLRQLMTRRQCMERCLNENSFSCLSAVFKLSQKNIRTRTDDQLLYGEKNEMGMCILSREDKSTQASSYRVADTDVEYIENQCVARSKASSYCSYEHYEHSTLSYPEVEVMNLDETKCQEMCSTEASFICNGYSYSNEKSYTKCVLHSEDLVSLGPRSLLFHKSYEYMRRVECLNVTVFCENNEMLITYTPKPYFNGKIYAVQHSSMDNCSADGRGSTPTVLKLRIGDEATETTCGIQRALQSPDVWKKYLLTTNVVIQSNPSVQTQGDRIVRVGCIFSNQPNVGGNPPDLPLNQSIAVAPNEPDSGSDFVNRTNRELPLVDLQIIDLDAHLETGSVQLGQNLELRINVRPINSPYDIHAFNLVAKSDSGHVLTLVNQQGCPQNVKIFPELKKVVTDKQRYLYSRFHAFKFPDSSAVNFDVVIHFCPRNCPPVSCDGNVQSFGKRRKRGAPRQSGIVDDSYNYFGNYPINPIPQYQYPTTKQPFQQQPVTACFLVVNTQPPVIQTTTTTTTTTPKPLGPVLFPGSVSRTRRSPEMLKVFEYKVDNDVIGDSEKSWTKKQLEEAAMVEQTTRGNFTDNQRVLIVDTSEIPLQIKLTVFPSKNVSDADRILYGDNNVILVSGLDTENREQICINESLLIAILIFWCIFQIILLICCFYAIKRYKQYLEMNEDKRVLQRINQRMEYERRVHWADQNGQVYLEG